MWPVLIDRLRLAARLTLLLVCLIILIALVIVARDIPPGNPNRWCQPWC